jgi:hypothetical protein
VAGAVLDFFGPQVVTDAGGAFARAFYFPSEQAIGFDLSAPDPASVPLRFTIPGLYSLAAPWSGELALPTASLEIRLTDELGASVTGTVALKTPSTGGLGFGSRGLDGGVVSIGIHWRGVERRTAAGGRVHFAHVPPGGYTLTAHDAETAWAPLAIEIAEGEQRTIDLARPRGGALELVVLDADSAPRAGARVLVHLGAEAVQGELPARESDLRGEVRFASLPPGPVSVYVFDGIGHIAAQAQAEIRAGETVQLVLSAP